MPPKIKEWEWADRRHDPKVNDQITELYTKWRRLGQRFGRRFVDQGHITPDEVDAATFRAVARALPKYDASRNGFSAYLGPCIKTELQKTLVGTSNLRASEIRGKRVKQSNPLVVSLDALKDANQRSGDDISESNLYRFLSDDTPPVEETVMHREVIGKIIPTIQSLSPRDRHILQAHYLDGVSVPELMTTLNITKKDIRNSLNRSLATLRKTLKAYKNTRSSSNHRY